MFETIFRGKVQDLHVCQSALAAAGAILQEHRAIACPADDVDLVGALAGADAQEAAGFGAHAGVVVEGVAGFDRDLAHGAYGLELLSGLDGRSELLVVV